MQSAYRLPSSTNGAGKTVAIVDAYDNPNAEADLGVYRSQFGLPACTTANGCFRKVDQNGGTTYPSGNVSWGQEIALDLDMVSAACPNCRILLVEANSASFTDLATAVDTAANLGANAISNSYGANESSTADAYLSHYNHPGRAITVSSGDQGFAAGPQFPADAATVTAVGGTSLVRDGSARGWSESAWSGAGSGCSSVPKPAWQKDSGCGFRMIADVAAVADPSTGVAVYDSYCSQRSGCGWLVFGGTSVASPLVGAVYALGNSAVNDASSTYAAGASLFDVTTGSNGSCSITYFCNAVPGYDGPTGNGTPNGATAF